MLVAACWAAPQGVNEDKTTPDIVSFNINVIRPLDEPAVQRPAPEEVESVVETKPAVLEDVKLMETTAMQIVPASDAVVAEVPPPALAEDVKKVNSAAVQPVVAPILATPDMKLPVVPTKLASDPKDVPQVIAPPLLPYHFEYISFVPPAPFFRFPAFPPYFF